jgi:peptidoglycan/LPS O-acetylase OafA/YrhL
VLAGTIVVSTISYYFFELPAMRLRSRITRSSQEPAAGPVPGQAAVRRAA